MGFPELTHTTKMSLRSAGKRDAAKIFSEALETAPTRDLNIRKAWAAHVKNVLVPYTPEEALSLSIETHLTKNQYIKFRIQAQMKNCNIYPSYHVIRTAKEERYPSKDATLIQEPLVESEAPSGLKSFKNYYGSKMP